MGMKIQTKGPWPFLGNKEKARGWKRYQASLTADDLKEIRTHQDNFELIHTFDSVDPINPPPPRYDL